MIEKLSQAGIKSDYAFAAGFASIGLTFAAWTASRIKPSDSKDQADRWGIFVGHWTPSLLALGVALRQEELANQRR